MDDALANDTEVCWQWRRIDDIEPRLLLGLLQLRSRVFVVEQRCAYLDIDEADPGAWHLVGLVLGQRNDPPGDRAGDQARTCEGDPAGDQVVATLRLLPPGLRYPEASIGRVCTSPQRRGLGLGRALMLRGLEEASRLFPRSAVRISAQQRLERFYRSLGFVTVSAPYDEDGIPHVEMLRQD